EPTMKLHEKLDRWYDQAVEEGIEQGQHQGLAKAVALQARLRFGELPAWAHERLAAATDAELERWLAGMLSATSLQDLLS
ncbi:MAG: hypothetical protein N2055_10320, partial [Tepidimonas taiwanensis]|nr:hypothetical protein [Tepidimonas taiwanensis]